MDDFLAFARLFLGAGAVDGVRILKPETMALMTTNRLSEAQRASAQLLGMPVFTAHGFGLGVAVVLDPENPHCKHLSMWGRGGLRLRLIRATRCSIS